VQDLKHKLQLSEELCNEYKAFYEGVMHLTEWTDKHTMQDIPMESRNILAWILNDMKLRKSNECNKVISTRNADLIVFRNGLISAIELLMQLLSTEKPKSGVSLLDRTKKGLTKNT